MMKILQNTLAAILTAAATFAVATDVNAQLAANTYQFSAINGTYTDIVGGTPVTGLYVDDGTSAAINIGFTFNYCGTDYTQLKACSNGWATFNTAVTSNTWTNSTGDINTIKPSLLPLFDDLAGWGTGAAVSYVVTGTAPNQIFTLEFKNWNWRGTTGNPPNISFQIKLYQSTNLIQYVYRQEAAAGNPGGATIGIGDNAATAGYLVLNNATNAPTASSTVFTTNIVAKPATGQIYQFRPLPPIDMKADSILVDAQFCSNANQPASVKVSNSGTATINNLDIYWSVDGVAQTPVTYSAAPITNVTTAPNNVATILLGDVFYPDNNPRTIKAWVYQPNGLQDAVNTNDTVSSAKAANLVGVIAHITPHDTTICSGTTITLDGGVHPNNPIYVWNNAQIGQTISVDEAGTYRIKIQNADGCFDYDTVTVSVHPDPLVNSIAIIDKTGGSYDFNVIGAQNITSYTWDFGDGTTPVTENGTPGLKSHDYIAAGDYMATLTLRNDCGEIVVTKRINTTGAPTVGIGDVSALQKEISLFPNPGKSMVVISNEANIKMKRIVVSNVLGQQVLEHQGINSVKFSLNISSLSNGIYNVTIDTENGSVTKKMEVLK